MSADRGEGAPVGPICGEVPVVVVSRRDDPGDGRVWRAACSCGQLEGVFDPGELGVALGEHWERHHRGRR